MGDYTPTTEEVYRRFWRGTPLRSEDKLREYVALDRWLAEVKAQEREHIIKLLEDTPATRTTWIDDGISVYALDKDDFIELIKGEEQ